MHQIFFIKQYLDERINIPNDFAISDIMCLYVYYFVFAWD